MLSKCELLGMDVYLGFFFPRGQCFMCNKPIQNFKAENDNGLLFLMIVWVKNPGRAQLGSSPVLQATGWVD